MCLDKITIECFFPFKVFIEICTGVCEHWTKAFQRDKFTMGQIMKLQQIFYSHRKKSKMLSFWSIVRLIQYITGLDLKAKDTLRRNSLSLWIMGKKFLFAKISKSIFGITKHRVAYVMDRLFYTAQFPIKNVVETTKTVNILHRKSLSTNSFRN